MSISPVFNVADLFPYRGTFKPPILPSIFAGTSSTLVHRAPSTNLELPDEIIDVLNDEFVNSHSGGYRRLFNRRIVPVLYFH